MAKGPIRPPCDGDLLSVGLYSYFHRNFRVILIFSIKRSTCSLHTILCINRAGVRFQLLGGDRAGVHVLVLEESRAGVHVLVLEESRAGVHVLVLGIG